MAGPKIAEESREEFGSPSLHFCGAVFFAGLFAGHFAGLTVSVSPARSPLKEPSGSDTEVQNKKAKDWGIACRH